MSSGLDRNTKITVGAAATILASVLSGAFWINGQLQGVRSEITSIRVELARAYVTKTDVDEMRLVARKVAVLEQRVVTLERKTR